MEFDPIYGHVWTGHEKGIIRVWDSHNPAVISEDFKCFHCPVRVIAVHNRIAWCGGDRGNVRVIALQDSRGAVPLFKF